MKVGELIEQLQQLDPELHVFVRGYEGGYDDAGPATPPNDFAKVDLPLPGSPRTKINSFIMLILYKC